MRLLLLCAFSGVRAVVGLITGGSWCCGTAALAAVLLDPLGRGFGHGSIIPPHKLKP